MKKKQLWIAFLLVFCMVFAFSDAQAQDGSDLTLRLRRDWGYGSGADIQGNMTIYIDGDLSAAQRVVYYIDDAVMAELSEEPFRFSFTTDDYQPGVHQMRAEVSLADGTIIPVGPIVYNFLSAGESGQITSTLIGIIVVITLAGMGISWFISSRQKGGSTTGGGMHGLAVCNRCGKTFSRSFLGLNIVVGKFERCPHCGKWQITRRASPLEIEMAENQNRPEETPEVTPKPEKDDLDDSRFVDM
ncbi:MAG: hypothetical protein PHW11_03450 [Anaerolineaceae bacterium]|jgi:hypothetical protein|nr:hypothetical protein [Anaerolineaceae bacterium]MDD4042728.1 hypothetical protein [Anaerolineaceae bacterium]MDD4577063.1 hypothetical protein [Anaerolineaceae bacterium]